jgi:enoyl-CoA hydratase/carnithine racemase
MGAASPDSGDLIEVEPARPGSPVAVVTINRPAALNALTKPMMISLAAAFRRLGADDSVAAVVLAGRGRAFCSGVDLTAAEEVFKGDVKDVTTDPVAQMELCRKPIVGAIAGFAVTAGFEIALACDILVAGRSAKFLDTHAKYVYRPPLHTDHDMLESVKCYNLAALATRLAIRGTIC